MFDRFNHFFNLGRLPSSGCSLLGLTIRQILSGLSEKIRANQPASLAPRTVGQSERRQTSDQPSAARAERLFHAPLVGTTQRPDLFHLEQRRSNRLRLEP